MFQASRHFAELRKSELENKREETGESRGGGASSPLSESLEQARAHKKSASHYYIRVQCVTVRSISADRNGPYV